MKKLIAIAGDPMLRDVNRMELLVAFIVVVISACLEGYGLHQSIKEANERMERTNTPRMGVFRFWRHTKSAEVASVIMGGYARFDRFGVRRSRHWSCDSARR